MKYLHLFSRDKNNKFSTSYIKFIERNFDEKNHMFFITGKNDKANIFSNVYVLNKEFRTLLYLIKKMHNAEKIYLHSLDFYMVLLYIFQPWLLKRTYWIIWGGDLYFHIFKRKTLVYTLYDLFRKFVISNVVGIITQIKGDYELAKKWYGAKGKYYYCFLYPSNLYKDVNLNNFNKEKGKLYIQVGNSACSTNEHIESFEKLAKFRDRDIEIICPLSYSGKQEYIDKVINKGLEIFGEERFSPILDFMPFEDYLELLGKIDVAIFNHRRQRGLGNITTLLGLGKKVYVREEITTWDFCEEHGLKVYSANSDLGDIFEPISKKNKEKNHKVMKEQFTTEKLVSDWDRIFSSH